MKNTSRTIAARIPFDLAQRLDLATDRQKNPYAPTLSQIVVRGIELALAELQKKGKR